MREFPKKTRKSVAISERHSFVKKVDVFCLVVRHIPVHQGTEAANARLIIISAEIGQVWRRISTPNVSVIIVTNANGTAVKIVITKHVEDRVRQHQIEHKGRRFWDTR